MPDLPYIEAIESVRLVTCPACAALHGLPEAMFLLAREKQTAIYCPAGHAWTPGPFSADGTSNPAQTVIELRAALTDARAKLEASRRRIFELTPAANLTPRNSETGPI